MALIDDVSHGTLTLNPSGSFTYTPNPQFHGQDSFVYELSDTDSDTDQATVTITVNSVDDLVDAINDSYSTPEDTTLTVNVPGVLTNDSAPDGGESVALIDDVSHGTLTLNLSGSFTYTPDPQFHGEDSFVYELSDTDGDTDQALVTITINSVDDPVDAVDDLYEILFGDELSILVPGVMSNDTAVDGGESVTLVSDVSNGALSLNGDGSFAYTPTFPGEDLFVYQLTDIDGDTDEAVVTIIVIGPPPVAGDDTGVTQLGETVVVNLVANDSDSDGVVVPSTLSLRSAPQGGRVELQEDGHVAYTPGSGFSGIDVFTYTVRDNDGKPSNVATVTILVSSEEEQPVPPVAQDDRGESYGAPTSIPVLGNDLDTDGFLVPESVDLVQLPQDGTVQSTGDGTLLYTPNAGFVGVDQFSYVVYDDTGMVSNAAVVTIDVFPEDPPTGGGGSSEPETCDGRVIISEIAWAGTPSDPDHEWIELRNLGSTIIDLTGWKLRWRPVEHDFYDAANHISWVSIPLSGEIKPAAVPACATGQAEAAPHIFAMKRNEDGVSWLVTGEPLTRMDGFYLLERRTDQAISDLAADLVYDPVEPFAMNLPDGGAVMQLVDNHGNIVDTANDDPRYGGRWVAGDPSTSASMERIDPLGADSADNWQTNLGIETYGEDILGIRLSATPATLNSGTLEGYEGVLAIDPIRLDPGPGTEFAVVFQDENGLPWVRVSTTDNAAAQGAGGATESTPAYSVGYSYRMSFTENSESVAIDTGDLPAGRYGFWLALGDERLVYVPVEIVR